MNSQAGRGHLVEYLTHLRDSLDPEMDTNKTQLIDRLLTLIHKDRFFQIFKELDEVIVLLQLLYVSCLLRSCYRQAALRSYNMLPKAATYCPKLLHAALSCYMLPKAATYCSKLLHAALSCYMPPKAAACCSKLLHSNLSGFASSFKL